MTELSVIVPAYNAENFISDCLDSILNQVKVNIEIIVVNDASTDNTREILDNYAQKYDSINIIDMPQNCGPGISRNEGIKHASGKYIGFVDSDDWIDLNFYNTLINSIKIEDCDIAIAGIADEYNNPVSSSLRYNYEDAAVIDGKTGLKLLTKSRNLGMFITPIMNNKIYKTDFIKNNNIHCCNNKSWQDDFFSFFAILFANKICITPSVVYHYRQNNASITHSGVSSKIKIDNCIDVLIKIKDELRLQNLYEMYERDYNAFIERCITSLLIMLRRESHASLDDNLTYLLDKFSQNFSISKMISYLDNERIYKFFNL